MAMYEMRFAGMRERKMGSAGVGLVLSPANERTNVSMLVKHKRNFSFPSQKNWWSSDSEVCKVRAESESARLGAMSQLV